MITTTLNRIRAHSPCSEGWAKLLARLGKTKGDDDPLPFSAILESNGLDDAIWCCVAEPQYQREWRLFAVWCAREVQHLMDDPRSVAALDVAENHANGLATDGELAAAWDAAWDAARDARDAAGAAWAAWAAWDAAWDAARDAAGAAWAAWAAWDAAWDAARDAGVAGAAGAARDARDAAGVAGVAGVAGAAGAAQRIEFLRVVTETQSREAA